ncbi:hypothetical protein ACP179_15705 [Xenorhabdus stockiae]|uniref:hypothetical protein n=1 Tax=Xenorhabdus stockiae TaxID=351614 RepID=UPI003CEE3816
MNNDVIELSKKLRSSLESERELIGKYPTIFFGHYLINAENIVKICREIENLHNKLAEYENMKPVAIYNIADGEVYKSIHDIGDNKSVFAVSLYPRPNK